MEIYPLVSVHRNVTPDIDIQRGVMSEGRYDSVACVIDSVSFHIILD